MPEHSLGEEVFPTIQPESPLAQVEAIPSSLIACDVGEEADPHHATASFQILIESDKVFPKPPLFQSEQFH